MQFKIAVIERNAKTFFVDADSPQEAKDIFEGGDENDIPPTSEDCLEYGIVFIEDEQGKITPPFDLG